MLLEEVRAATAKLHQELEAVLDIPKQVQTRSQYEALLASFLALYAPWEEALARFTPEWSSLGLDFSERRRTPRLGRDLRALRAENKNSLCGTDAGPALPSYPRALGSLYVLEGSSLGGQVLTRHFAATLGLTPDTLQFFGSHGAETGRKWKEFCAALERAGESFSAPERREVVRGAEESFAALLSWFTRHPIPNR